MEYAVIETGGKQYKVTPGLVLEIDSLDKTDGNVSFEKVLLHVLEGKAHIGTPYVQGLSISAKVLGATKGEKVRVSKFKAKSRYRRSMGFRASLTSVEFLPFGKEAKKVEAKAPAKKSK